MALNLSGGNVDFSNTSLPSSVIGGLSYANPSSSTPFSQQLKNYDNLSSAGVSTPTQTASSTTIKAPSTTISTPKSMTSGGGIGSYKGVTINPGTDAQIAAQIASIDASQNVSNLPVSGSPQYNAASYVSGNSNLPSATNNYSANPIGDSGIVQSSSLGGNSIYNDILNQRAQYEKNLLNAYNSPDLQQARQALADANNALAQGNFNALTDRTDALTNGNMTREQAIPFANQADLLNAYKNGVSQLAVNTATNKLGVLTQNQSNQISGYNALLGANQQDIQNQLAQVPGYIGTVTSPTGDLLVQTRDPLTGQVITTPAANIYSSGSSGSMNGGGNIVTNTAQALVDGRMAPSQLSSTGLNPAYIYQVANQISMQTKGVPFNAQQAEANYGATTSALNQNATTYRTLQNAQGTAIQHLNDLETYFNQINKTSYPGVNSVFNLVQRALGSGALQSYETTLQNARGEVAKVLAGGGAPSDADLKAANATLPDNMSPAQFKGAIEATKLLMQQKIAEYSNTGNVAQYGGGNSNPLGI